MPKRKGNVLVGKTTWEMTMRLLADDSSAELEATKASRAFVFLQVVGMLAAALLLPREAAAADGCKVLLCLAAPSWRNIPACVPPVQEVMRDLALGRPFPVCDMSGSGNGASHQWSSAPAFCPPQYTRAFDGNNGTIYSCDYVGAFTVEVDGAPWSQTWWQVGGDSVTDFFPSAKARLGTWDTRFDDDYANWLASQPAPTNPH